MNHFIEGIETVTSIIESDKGTSDDLESNECDQMISMTMIKESSSFSAFFFQSRKSICIENINCKNNPYYLPAAVDHLNDYIPIFPL